MKKTIKQTLQAEWFLIKLMFRTDAVRGIIYWLLVGAQYLFPLISVWLWKQILDELTAIFHTKEHNRIVWIYLGIYLTLQVLASVLVQANTVIHEKIKRKASFNLDMAVMEKMAEIDAAFYDNPENFYILRAAQSSESYIAANMPWAINAVIRIIAFISGLVMFLSYDWIVGLIFMATYIPGVIVSCKHKAKVDQWSIENIPENQKKDYYKSLLTDALYAKDLRLYNLADYMKEKYKMLWNKIRNERHKLFIKSSVASFLASLLTYGGIVLIILLSVRLVLLGDMEIGTLALYIGLAQTSGENFRRIVEDFAGQLGIVLPRVVRYMDFLKYENAIKDQGTQTVSGCPDIEFCHVFFKYPGNTEYTLHDLSFKIKGGKKIALIGVNGSGKTTIIKLLLRFYEPESGDILVNGKSIRCYPMEELHKLFGICFQDINRYSLTLRENIAISDIERIGETEAVKAAATASGAHKIIEELAEGLEADVTRRFHNNGVDFSGGQWQKIALARAFFRNAQYIILDEPSSALDPEAEDYIFSSFRQLCHDKGGILISHRLSSIMVVDEILVIDKGTVIESGTHEVLMQKNGKYAQLYRMQAEKYGR